MAFSMTTRSRSSDAAPRPPPLDVRVATYNVLSSHLADPDHFSTLKPEDLDASNRLEVIKDKLKDEITSNSIICLQEVSHDWAGEFHTYFANSKYYFVYGPYGKPFNGYMGVGIAYPMELYKLLQVDISRLADKREGGWPKPPLPPSTALSNDDEHRHNNKSVVRMVVSKTWNICTTTLLTVTTKVIRPYYQYIKNKLISTFQQQTAPQRPPIDHWHMSSQRWNILVTLKLQHRVPNKNSNNNSINGDDETTTLGHKFAVSTYHMPCAYYAPMVMTIHVDLAARYLQRLCGVSGSSSSSSSSSREGRIDGNDNDSDDDTCIPYILAGDWNIKPDSSSYRLLTTGLMDRGDPDWPTPKYGVEWTPTLRPMKSAYAHINGGIEPPFTNYARIKEQEPFIETLDYIFVSDEWKINSVKSLPTKEEAGGPFPNLQKNEPSDHVLIAADLQLP